MGADGPGKAEIALAELMRARASSATTGSRRATAASWRGRSRRGIVARERVTQLGDVLAGRPRAGATRRRSPAFDSTGLAIQDLAVALAALERAGDLDLPQLAV